MVSKYQRQIRNQAIGIKTQEIVAILLEKYYPSPEFKIISNGTRHEDIVIFYHDVELLTCEVKTAIECFYHKYNHGVRRGMFNIEPHTLKVDFWAFLVRFTDHDLNWNGDYEIWWATNRDVKEYLQTQPLNCKNWKLCIDKLQIINATLDFNNINPLLKS